jgi:hypothetical protein
LAVIDFQHGSSLKIILVQALKDAAEAESGTWQAKMKQLRGTAKSKLNEQKKEIEQLQVN